MRQEKRTPKAKDGKGTSVAERHTVLTGEELTALDAHWRAANYLAVGQIYLMDNALLTEPLRPEHIKPRLLGHWGTSPGLNLVHTHLNRLIRNRDQSMLCVWGPGHGGPAVLANSWLEGTYTETYPDVTRDAAGMNRLFRQFSFPGGVPSHVAPETPGSIHEGGELGYSLAHAYGAALDNPDLLVACVIGDGEAETGPLAGSWHANKFLDPVHDGAVLPILHLNGYKIANPTVLARIPDDELDALLRGYGHEPLYVAGSDPSEVHRALAAALDRAADRITAIQRNARDSRDGSARDGAAYERAAWPMIVLRTPKGWTGPADVDGLPVEGTWRSHQVPLPAVRENPAHLAQLEAWLRSYRPDELFDRDGRPSDQVLTCVPAGTRRLGGTPHANGGLLVRDLPVPPLDDFAVQVDKPGVALHEPTRVLGGLLARIMADTADRRDFRVVGPDETASNRLEALFEATGKAWQAGILPTDEHLARDGRVMEVLSEHLCQGWLEGYLLTGRHGLFSCYEAFVHIVDSMVNQHIKWLKTSRELAWRRPVASLNYLLTSHVWRQDHNGFSHQDPGFVDHVLNKSPDVVRVYLPPDANTLLSVADHVLRSRDYVNVVVAGKQPGFDWLTMDEARAHCARGAGLWKWAGTEDGTREPDAVLACAGDVPTLEIIAAAGLLRRHLPELAIRVVNVVDMTRLMPREEHPHGMTDAEYDDLFTTDKPVIFAYHGYPWLIHRLAYRRTGDANLHVRGYKEMGTTTTPFDMVVRNDLDRYRLVMDVIDRVPGLGVRAADVRQVMEDTRTRHHSWIREHGVDLPEVSDWSWEG
ncbi:putative phosphoketolase [Streptomyces camponoticapitis]|uniref:Probable phosphoketolase n=1 Tax=Streptomyces camponoticapitis TaxID=1616125 RepID=A0ABQ2ERN8_9ACTN|nr:phosphoketolase family protein [Streptomyces camponoticapitis]GGK22482.1 putative phosphoketolase [Streptomyces camponoticapitis]